MGYVEVGGKLATALLRKLDPAWRPSPDVKDVFNNQVLTFRVHPVQQRDNAVEDVVTFLSVGVLIV